MATNYKNKARIQKALLQLFLRKKLAKKSSATAFLQAKNLGKTFSDFSVVQWERLAGLDKENLKQKMLELRFFLFQKISKKLGLDWRPTSAMKETVKEKPLLSDIYVVPQKVAEKKEYWKKFVDPRVDFYP